MEDAMRQKKKQKTGEDDSDADAKTDQNPTTRPEHFTRKEKIIIAAVERQPDMNYPEEYRSKSDDEELTPEPGPPLKNCELPKRKKKHSHKKDEVK